MVFIKTIIELYDEENIFNLLASLTFEPEFLVLIGTSKVSDKQNKNRIINFLEKRGLKTKVFFYSTDMESFDKILNQFKLVTDKLPDCYFDVTGGRDLALLATGVFCERENMPVFYYSDKQKCFKPVINCHNLPIQKDFVLSVSDIIALNGGSFIRHGHYFPEEETSQMHKYILDVWNVYIFNQNSWADNVAFLQHATKNKNGVETNTLFVDTTRQIQVNDRMKVRCQRHIMQNLQQAGVISALKIDENRVSFRYNNETIKKCLMDVGIWLELYTYTVCKMTGYFDDVQTSVVIDWDGKEDEIINTINEIDVILIKGLVPVFISCKISIPTTLALNEIKLLSRKFGGMYAKTVIVTSNDVSKNSPSTMQRASDMGIIIIDAAKLTINELAEKLKTIAKI